MAPDAPTWTNKPEAWKTFRAYRVTDEAELDELYQFAVDNPVPRWNFHHELPPFPARHGSDDPNVNGDWSFDFYWKRGNPIVAVRDADGLLWGWKIFSKKKGEEHKALWVHPRREADELHWALPDGTEGPSANALHAFAHMSAYRWKMLGGPREPNIPETLNPRINQLDHDYQHVLEGQIYKEHYEFADDVT